MLPFQIKQESLVSGWLILLSVAAGSEFVTFGAMFLRNLTQIPPNLRGTEREKLFTPAVCTPKKQVGIMQ